MEWDTILGPIATGALASFSEILPIGVPVLVALVGLGIGLRALSKLGVRR